MTDPDEVLDLVEKLNDVQQRESAKNKLISLGRSAVKPIYMAHFSQEGEAYLELYKIFIEIGDGLFVINGSMGIEKEIQLAMESGAKKNRQWAPKDIYTLSVDALNRWGLDIPPVNDQPVISCHVCGLKITEQRVKVCGLHSCNNAVCHQHRFLIKTRFGNFDGSGGVWFCTKGHYDHAQHNHIDWN